MPEPGNVKCVHSLIMPLFTHPHVTQNLYLFHTTQKEILKKKKNQLFSF